MIPNVGGLLSLFSRTAQVKLIIKTVDNFEVIESNSDRMQHFVQGSLQPTPTRELWIKPEGQRLWHWWTFYTIESMVLDTVVVDPNGVEMRVMKKEDWGSFYKYELAEGPAS